METFLIKALQLMMALAILVFVHEFGHYIFSRIFGVTVEKFYLFFNPKFSLFRMKKVNGKWQYKFFSKNVPDNYEEKEIILPDGKKEKEYIPIKLDTLSADDWRRETKNTEYGIGWLPLGGYCKIAGMIDESMDKGQMAQPEKPWEFRSKPAYQRLLIMVGGVVFNFILAILIYAGIVYAWGERFLPFRNASEGMMFSETAHKVGFQDGDIILNADEKKLDYLSAETLMAIVDADKVQVLRNKQDTVTIDIPEGFIFQANKDAENGQPLMDYRQPVVIAETQSGMGALKAGLQKGDRIIGVNGISTPSFDLFKAQLDAHKNQTTPILYIRDGKECTANIEIDGGGKIGILLTPITDIYETITVDYSLLQSLPRGVEMGVDKLTSYVQQMKYVFTKEGAESLGGFGALGSIFPNEWSWINFWYITAFLSVILAFMNILPIPALDGGHVLFLLVEIIIRRKPSDKFLEYANMAGMAFLILLMLYANGNDIYRFFFK